MHKYLQGVSYVLLTVPLIVALNKVDKPKVNVVCLTDLWHQVIYFIINFMLNLLSSFNIVSAC